MWSGPIKRILIRSKLCLRLFMVLYKKKKTLMVTINKMNFFLNISVTTPSSPTWHITVGAGRHIARRAATGLRGHAAGHRVQHQDDGVDEGWVRTDQPTKQKQMWIWVTFLLTLHPAYNSQTLVHTYMSSMLGSVNCTNRSLSWRTPAKEQRHFWMKSHFFF